MTHWQKYFLEVISCFHILELEWTSCYFIVHVFLTWIPPLAIVCIFGHGFIQFGQRFLKDGGSLQQERRAREVQGQWRDGEC